LATCSGKSAIPFRPASEGAAAGADRRAARQELAQQLNTRQVPFQALTQLGRQLDAGRTVARTTGSPGLVASDEQRQERFVFARGFERSHAGFSISRRRRSIAHGYTLNGSD